MRGSAGHGPGWWLGVGVLGVACAVKPAQTPGHADPNLELPFVPKTLHVELGARNEDSAFEPIVALLEAELARSLAALSKLDVPPHFLAYQVTERRAIQMQASDGSLVDVEREASRILDVDLRVGTPERDDTRRIPGESPETFKPNDALPLELGEPATRNAIWLATDRAYDAALARWRRVEALDDAELGDADRPDFSREPKVVFGKRPIERPFDEASWKARLEALSRVALEYPDVQRSDVMLSVSTELRTLVNSEGSRLQIPRHSVRLEFQAETTASDGMVLSRFDSVDAREFGAIPSDDELVARFRRLFLDLEALAEAPLIDPYVGPAILDGRAAGVFFHEVFGHRIEGHRQDADNEGQTFANMVDQSIMHESLSIYDDPNITRLEGTDLNGFYLFDDEGVPGQRALLVEDGVLRGFLLSRAPARGFHQSNGHGRREPGHVAVARQANLVVNPNRTVSREGLVRALLAEVERQELPYGLRFAEISGGFTQTQRTDTQAFKVIPVMVYRVYPDGRQELVRGVDIEGTPLTALSKISLAANDFAVFNGICGAESGWVPVSATSPSLLLSQIEVARQEQGDTHAPILPPPATRQPDPHRPADGAVPRSAARQAPRAGGAR